MIGLIDGNNFFVSCERIFNPKLTNIPVIVLSNNDGCVIARSEEVKKLGVKMGQPIFEMKDLITKHNIRVFSSNFVLYGDISDRIMSIISEFSPQIETYSIDEAFCNLSFIENNTLSLTEYGWKIKNRIKKCVDIPCGIGISYTKVLAKIANRIAKKSPKANGVLALVEDSHIDYALSITDVEDIWGIGKQYAKFLKKNGINTAKDFRDADEKWVEKNMTIVGLRMLKELRKESCIELETLSKPKKSIVVSRSFAKYITTFDELISPLSYFVSSGCAKLRKQKSETCQIGIYLRTNPFAKNRKQYSTFRMVDLPFYTNCDFHIMKAAELCLKSIYKEGFEYKKCGVYFFKLSPQSDLPSNLFDRRNIVKERQIFHSFDQIKHKFGMGSIYLATASDYSWKPKFILKSPSYTTNIEEIISI